MDGHNDSLPIPQSEPVVAELETDEVPSSLVSEFSSLTTPYCWVITEDAVAAYDGAAPSAVGKSGRPEHRVSRRRRLAGGLTRCSTPARVRAHSD
jgi:hypothetical protein